MEDLIYATSTTEIHIYPNNWEGNMRLDDFKKKKLQQHKISMLTCYDYPSACIVAESNVDCVLVGDSVAMTIHGHPSTIMATMDMLEMHTAAVARGIGKKFLISDLPFLAYHASKSETIHNVKRLMQAGAMAIKLEGGDNNICETVNQIVSAGVPVMGHIGLTPQAIMQLGGYKIQGRGASKAELIMQQAHMLQEAGCFAIVIECVPGSLAKKITSNLNIPTIGIGAGSDTDGQVLVWHDLLGMQSACKLSFVKQFINTKQPLLTALNKYANEVQNLEFPTSQHTFAEE